MKLTFVLLLFSTKPRRFAPVLARNYLNGEKKTLETVEGTSLGLWGDVKARQATRIDAYDDG